MEADMPHASSWFSRTYRRRSRFAVAALTGAALLSPACGRTLHVGPAQTYAKPSLAAALWRA